MHQDNKNIRLINILIAGVVGFTLLIKCIIEFTLATKYLSTIEVFIGAGKIVATILFFSSMAYTLLYIGRNHSITKIILYSMATVCGFGLFYIICDPLFSLNDLIPIHHSTFAHLTVKSISLLIVTSVISWIESLYQKRQYAEHQYELLKIETLESQIEALSNQINPHFFFNALNSLYSLILEDKKQHSLDYLANLSNLFRYILQSEQKELTTLKDELDFLDSYSSMLHVKYGDKLSFDINIAPSDSRCKLPALSLLPLIENVAKHNEISAAYPMIIELYSSNKRLSIRNIKQPKLDTPQSNKIGLTNLNKRFELLVNQSIQIEDTENKFTIHLPLI